MSPDNSQRSRFGRKPPPGTPADEVRPGRLAYAARVARRIRTDPFETAEKLRERAALRRERVIRRGKSPRYSPSDDWELRLHQLLGRSWPCPDAAAFARLWSEVIELMTARGLTLGRRSYGGDDDADQGLARALWCLVAHIAPEKVIETGVAHGVSSRCILEGLERNGHGRLWSIDLPPLTIPERRQELGVAVPPERRGRWTYVEGSSRRRLPSLLGELGEIDLFLHDSLHSTRNTRWELERAWSALRPGGALVADDIDHNWGFRLFVDSVTHAEALQCPADDGKRLFGIVLKRPTAS
jgi:hypothetical protein